MLLDRPLHVSFLHDIVHASVKYIPYGFDKVYLGIIDHGREDRHILALVFRFSDLEFHIVEIIAVNIHTYLDDERRLDQRRVIPE